MEKKKNTEELIGQVSPEQIEQWKKQHGDVFGVVVEGHIGYLKKPDRKVIGFASVAGKVNPIKFNETLLKNCWLGGSEEIQKDDDLFFAASGQLADLIEVKQAELVKL